MLCGERLQRIQRLLARHSGSLSIRAFARSYGVQSWEIEEAVALGWLMIEIQTPTTGRPSRIVREVSKPHSAKLPPWRRQIEKTISIRHYLFAIHSMLAVRRGSHSIISLDCMTDAYQKTYRDAKNRRAASASVSRLLRRPHIRAARAFYHAQINGKIPRSEHLPDTASEIRARLKQCLTD